jgi:type I restriction enzyme S subunit
MDLKPGYKRTDIGSIPEDWDLVPVGNLLTFKNGLNKAKQFFGYGTPIVNYMDVFGRAALRTADMGGRVHVSPKELKAYEVRKGDVFFTRTSETVEEIGVTSVMLDDPKNTVYSGFVLRARPTDQSLDDAFKSYCFSPRYFRQQVTARASYTTRALTNGRSLSAALLARPPLPEQRAIAGALSNVDALLGALDRLIAKKRDLKQAAMQQLLTGQTRLPGFTGDWEVKRLGELGRFLKGSGIRRDEAQSGDLPCVRYGELYTTHQNVVRSFTSWISSPVAAGATRAQRGDLLFAGSGETKGEIGTCAAIIEDVEAYAGGDIVILRLQSGDPTFFGYLMNTPKVARQKANLGQGDAVVHISAAALASVAVAIPDEPEQQAIAAVLSDMDAELDALEQRRAKTAALKQGMMQELLTGRTRLV